MDTPVIESAVPSTATQTPQSSPEATATQPKSPEVKSKGSFLDQAFERIKAQRAKQESGNSEPAKAVADKTAESAQPKSETGTEETLSDNSPYLEAVTVNGKDVPVSELFDKAEFEIFANGEYKQADLRKVMDMASIGYAATKKVEAAKEAIRQADATVREEKTRYEQKLSQEVNKGVENYLNDLLNKAQNGVNPGTGKPFENQAQRTGAVALVNKMIDLNASGAKSSEALTMDEIEKRVEAKLNEKLGQTEKQKAEQYQQQVLAQITQTAESTLQKETEPLMQFFIGEDGKTVNQEQFEDFKELIRKKADKLFTEAKSPMDPKKSSEFVSKATQQVLSAWKSSLKMPSTSTKQPPVGGTGSGVPASIAPKQKFTSKQQALDAKIKDLMAARRTS